ncbi:MAG: response regulator [Candidatus Omnitrophica bacterium]|nr:response regulator [Candidatus Omnitrophota bacterium]MDD5671801.1 response regulator [Candidatus Omnitrophota bacterium]
MVQKILVVDDDPVVQKILDQALRRNGFEVLLASSGEDGLTQAREHVPELIILDVLLPSLDGTEIAGLLQEDYKTHHIPVIYLTGLEAKEDAVLESNLEHDIIFSKPVDIEKLVAKVLEVTKKPN